MGAKNKILVADDSATIRLLLEEYLSDDYETITAKDGKKTLEKFKNESPDLLILDLQMPEIDGFKICEAVNKDSDVPVIILSSMSEESDIDWARDRGADIYLKKPVDKDEVLEAVEKGLKN